MVIALTVHVNRTSIAFTRVLQNDSLTRLSDRALLEDLILAIAHCLFHSDYI